MRPFNVFVPAVNSNYVSVGRRLRRHYANGSSRSPGEARRGSESSLSLPALVLLFSVQPSEGGNQVGGESLGKLLE